MSRVGHNSGKAGPRYAIFFDLDTDVLKKVYPGQAWSDAYNEMRSFLEDQGFVRRQGCTYFGDETVNEVSCILVIQDLAEEFDWFGPAVREVRMLRIEADNDLMPAVRRALKRRAG